MKALKVFAFWLVCIKVAQGVTVTNIVPTDATAAGGETITVTGTSFGSTSPGANEFKVYLGSTECSSFEWISDTECKCVVPPGSGGGLDVLVFRDPTTSSTGNSLFTYKAPTVSSVADRAVCDGTTAVVTITGVNFGGVTTTTMSATWAGNTCGSPTHVSDTTMLCSTSVAGSGGNLAVLVTAASLTSASVNAMSYKDPTVSSVGQLGNTDGTSVDVTITGVNFGGSSNTVAASIAGSACSTPTYVSNTEITCQVSQTGEGINQAVVVTANSLTSSSSSVFCYKIPTINSLTPTSGSTEGETTTISGQNFGVGTSFSISVGGATCSSVSYVSSQALLCKPASARGSSVTLVVTVASQSATGTYSFKGPTITGVVGTSSTSGSAITISGSNFGPSSDPYGTTNVQANGQDCTSVTHNSNTQVLCTPVSGTGTGMNVYITFSGQDSGTNGNGLFSYTAPAISSADRANTDGTTTVTVTGTNFGASGDATLVINGGTCSCSGTNYVSHTQLICCPSAGTGTGYDIAVTVGGQTASGSGLFSYFAPTISSVSRPKTDVGATFTVSGTNFGATDAGASISLSGGLSCVTSYSSAHTTLLCVMADNGNGEGGSGSGETATITVNGQSGTGGFSFALPTVSSASIVDRAGGVLTVTGANFGGVASSITVNVVVSTLSPSSQECTGVSLTTSHSVLTCTMPAGYGGSNDVGVTVNGQVNSDASTNNLMSYTPPSLTAVTPVSLRTDGTETITLDGSSFGTTDQIAASDITASVQSIWGCQSTNHVSNTQVLCTAPAAYGLTRDVTLDIGGASSTLSSVMSFKAPTLSASTPSSGTTEGQTLTISGDNFVASSVTLQSSDSVSADVSMSLGSFSCASVSLSTVSQFTCTLSAGAGLDLSGSLTMFSQSSATKTSMYSYQGPTVTSINPDLVSTSGGDTVTLSGSNFGPSSETLTASISGSTATVSSHDHTTAIIVTPSGTGSGMMVMVTIASQTSSGSGSMFSYASPTVTAASFGSTGGSTITLSGSNFGNVAADVSAITVAGSSCTSPNPSQTTMTCVVASGYGTGKDVSMTINGQSTSATGIFSYMAPTITSITYGHTDGSTSVTISGSNFYSSSGLLSVALADSTCSSPAILTAHEAITCVPIAGSGRGYNAVVSVNGRASATVTLFSYSPPGISSIDSSLDSSLWVGSGQVTLSKYNGGSTLSIVGTNFGSAQGDIAIDLVDTTDSANVQGCEITAFTAHTNLECVPSCTPLETCIGGIFVPRVGVNGEESSSSLQVYVPCSEGYYSADGDGYGTCTECPAGSYKTMLAGTGGVNDCTLCAAGTENANTAQGSNTCTDCAKDSFSNEGAAACTVCTDLYANTQTESTGSGGDTSCGCVAESWKELGTVGDCITCTPTVACLAFSVCETGYTGTRCAECQTSPTVYRKVEPLNICEPCPATGQYNGIIAGVFLIILAGVLMRIAKGGKGYARFFTPVMQIFKFIQVANLIATVDVPWPFFVDDFFGFEGFSFFNLSISIASPECAFTTPYWAKWSFVMVSPIVIIIVYIGYFTCCFPWHFFRKDVKGLIFQIIRSYLWFLLLAYVPLCTTAFEPWDCSNVTGNVWTLDAQASITCFVDMEWWFLATASIVCIIVWVFGIPGLYLAILLASRKSGVQKSRDFEATFGFLFSRYEDRVRWWEIPEMFWKLSIVLAEMFLSGHRAAALGVIAFILATNVAGKTYFGPYIRDWEDYLSTGVVMTNIIITGIGMYMLFKNETNLDHQILEYFMGSLVLLAVFLIICCACVMMLLAPVLEDHEDKKRAKKEKKRREKTERKNRKKYEKYRKKMEKLQEEPLQEEGEEDITLGWNVDELDETVENFRNRLVSGKFRYSMVDLTDGSPSIAKYTKDHLFDNDGEFELDQKIHLPGLDSEARVSYFMELFPRFKKFQNPDRKWERELLAALDYYQALVQEYSKEASKVLTTIKIWETEFFDSIMSRVERADAREGMMKTILMSIDADTVEKNVAFAIDVREMYMKGKLRPCMDVYKFLPMEMDDNPHQATFIVCRIENELIPKVPTQCEHRWRQQLFLIFCGRLRDPLFSISLGVCLSALEGSSWYQPEEAVRYFNGEDVELDPPLGTRLDAPPLKRRKSSMLMNMGRRASSLLKNPKNPLGSGVMQATNQGRRVSRKLSIVVGKLGNSGNLGEHQAISADDSLADKSGKGPRTPFTPQSPHTPLSPSTPRRKRSFFKKQGSVNVHGNLLKKYPHNPDLLTNYALVLDQYEDSPTVVEDVVDSWEKGFFMQIPEAERSDWRAIVEPLLVRRHPGPDTEKTVTQVMQVYEDRLQTRSSSVSSSTGLLRRRSSIRVNTFLLLDNHYPYLRSKYNDDLERALDIARRWEYGLFDHMQEEDRLEWRKKLKKTIEATINPVRIDEKIKKVLQSYEKKHGVATPMTLFRNRDNLDFFSVATRFYPYLVKKYESPDVSFEVIQAWEKGFFDRIRPEDRDSWRAKLKPAISNTPPGDRLDSKIEKAYEVYIAKSGPLKRRESTVKFADDLVMGSDAPSASGVAASGVGEDSSSNSGSEEQSPVPVDQHVVPAQDSAPFSSPLAVEMLHQKYDSDDGDRIDPAVMRRFEGVERDADVGLTLLELREHYPELILRYEHDPRAAFQVADLWETTVFDKMRDIDKMKWREKLEQTIVLTPPGPRTEDKVKKTLAAYLRTVRR